MNHITPHIGNFISFTLIFCAVSACLVGPDRAYGAPEAAPKRVLVCSVAMTFRHGSIGHLHETLGELAESDGRFEIVKEVRHPEIQVPAPPRAPRAPAADAPADAHERFQRQQARFEEQRAAWTPEREAEREAALAAFHEGAKEALKALHPEALRAEGIDLVIFANTTGDLPLPDLDGFVQWIEEGGHFVGIHAATDTFKGTPRYTEMIQGIFDGHGPQVPATLHAGDTEHPANAGIGNTWHLPQEEMYLFRGHDREQVRTLWFMRHHPNHPEQAGHFPVAWCRMAGQGRVFYTSLGHREDLMSLDPDFRNRINPVEVARQYRAHVLGGILWALGLVEGSAEPNPYIQ